LNLHRHFPYSLHVYVQDKVQKEAVPSRRKSSWKELLMLAWPGSLNVMSIIVQGMGLQYISASVSQMISGVTW
jgi:hypothetical protein